MASAQPASAFPCLSLQLACLLLGAWLAFDAHGGGQAGRRRPVSKRVCRRPLPMTGGASRTA